MIAVRHELEMVSCVDHAPTWRVLLLLISNKLLLSLIVAIVSIVMSDESFGLYYQRLLRGALLLLITVILWWTQVHRYCRRYSLCLNVGDEAASGELVSSGIPTLL